MVILKIDDIEFEQSVLGKICDLHNLSATYQYSIFDQFI